MAETTTMKSDVGTKADCVDDSAKITLQNMLDIQFLEAANGRRTQSMRGFNPRYKDIVDYIIGVTHEIWEEKGIGKLYDYYANAIHLHTSSGLVYGREAVFAGTIESLAAFPDRRLYGDEVIWGGNDVDGFYTSHRLRHEGTNRGWTQYGPPTGKRVSYWSVADCRVIRNLIVEEWLCRDELSLVLQLGLDPVETAKEMAARAADSDTGLQIAGDIERGIGQLPPKRLPAPSSERFDPERFVRGLVHEIWNWRLLNKAHDYYQENFAFVGPSRRAFTGINDFQAYVLSLLSPFPDLAMTVDNYCQVGDERSGYRTAIRWTMRGTHTGYGVYGEPTGNPIRIMGVSHHVIRDERVENEWTIFDEFALLKQIFAR